MSNFQGRVCLSMNSTILCSSLMLGLVLPIELAEDENTNVEKDATKAAFYFPASPLSMTKTCMKVCKDI